MSGPELVEEPEVQWTNARLTQRSDLAKALMEMNARYEHDDWSSWDWGDEAEKIMSRLGLTR